MKGTNDEWITIEQRYETGRALLKCPTTRKRRYAQCLTSELLLARYLQAEAGCVPCDAEAASLTSDLTPFLLSTSLRPLLPKRAHALHAQDSAHCVKRTRCRDARAFCDDCRALTIRAVQPTMEFEQTARARMTPVALD